jgi:hypothetical protein
MRINYIKCIVLLLFLTCTNKVYSQVGEINSGLYLFTDREHCVSGDTVWFRVVHFSEETAKSNIVHIQLTNSQGKLITPAIKRSDGGWVSGYIYVPDSLSTGVYFLTAFYNNHTNVEGLVIQKKSLFVYNRFRNKVEEILVPAGEEKISGRNFNSVVSIKPDKTVSNPREKVSVEVGFDDNNFNEIKQVIIKAEYIDELAAETGGNFLATAAVQEKSMHTFQEYDGVLISGKVTARESNRGEENIVILLSLINVPHYFDYCITGPGGDFYFFLKNAVGVGELVLQAVSEKEEEWTISLDTVQLHSNRPVIMENKILTPVQRKFIEETVDAAFFKKVFGEAYVLTSSGLSIPPRFDMPFYGYPYARVVLSDFFDLPDFQEVSRELLHGVQYRERGDEITLRMINLNANVYFTDEPFRLINGIPVFKNRLLSTLGSGEIEFIDYVLEDRIFGDLRFSGVLAVYLKDQSNGWMARQSNLFRFSVPVLQPDATPNYDAESTSC